MRGWSVEMVVVRFLAGGGIWGESAKDSAVGGGHVGVGLALPGGVPVIGAVGWIWLVMKLAGGVGGHEMMGLVHGIEGHGIIVLRDLLPCRVVSCRKKGRIASKRVRRSVILGRHIGVGLFVLVQAAVVENGITSLSNGLQGRLQMRIL